MPPEPTDDQQGCALPPLMVLIACMACALAWISMFPLLSWLCRTANALIKGIV